MTDRTALYRFYAGNGDLLYVGITGHLPRRIGQHERTKPWAHWVSDVLVEYATTRVEALEREADAIALEGPLFNRPHSTREVDPAHAQWAQRYVARERMWNAAINLAVAMDPDGLTEPAIDELKDRLDLCFASWLTDRRAE